MASIQEIQDPILVKPYAVELKPRSIYTPKG